MQVIAICSKDDNDVEKVSSEIKKLNNAYSIVSMTDWNMTLSYLVSARPDLLILDIDNFDVDGVHACEVLREEFPNLKIVAVSKKSTFAVHFFEIGIFDFWLKPFTKERIRKSLRLGQTVFYRYAYRLFVRTMPNLELFVDMKPVYFRRPKCKELFAYLVDRNGAPCSTKDIMCALWPDAEDSDSKAAVCRNTFSRLKEELDEWGIGDVLISTKKGLRVLDTSCYEADIRRLLRGDLQVMKLYDGRYLDEYSWSEEKNASIARFVEENKQI